MYQTATITSKRQLTIPVDLYEHMGFKEGQKVLISIDDNALRVESALDIVTRLAGSLQAPERYKKLSSEDLIKSAKQEYLANKYSKSV